MTSGTRRAAGEAMAAALRMRAEAGVPLGEPVDPIDLAQRAGVEVRFVDFPSMEGLFLRTPRPAILVSALRPAGRRRTTCAHELGHFRFGHGNRYDELIEDRTVARESDPEEQVANAFAAALTMPKATVCRGFTARGWDPSGCTAEQAFVVAGWLGVGYDTLLSQISRTYRLLARPRAEALQRCRPKDLRARFLGGDCQLGIHVVDLAWTGRAVDAEVGDHLLLPAGAAIEGRCLERLADRADGSLVRAATPGIGRAISADGRWAAYVRVSRQEYVGLAAFRFEEDNDE